ncbi:MAG: hypothetical protein WCL20_03845 [Actinomycetes bacterium]
MIVLVAIQAVAFVSALAGIVTCRRRWRRDVADAIHEIRRPLSAIRLGIAAAARHPGAPLGILTSLDSELVRAASSLDELGVSAGLASESNSERFSLAALAADLAAAWTPAAAAAGRKIELIKGASALVEADRNGIGQAGANLIANSIEHGSGPIAISVVSNLGLHEIRVTDAGSSRTSAQQRLGKGQRRGAGLRISSSAAKRNGGRVTRGLGVAGGYGIELPSAEGPQ